MKNIKNFFTLSSSLIFAQFLSFILSPVISRIYSPIEFGIYTNFIVCISVFGPILSGKYETAIVQVSKNSSEEKNLTALSIIVGIIFSTFVSFIFPLIYFSSDLFTYIYSVFFLFLLLVSYFLNNILNSLNNNREDYKTIGFSTVIRSMYNNLFSVSGGYFLSTYITLVLSQVVSSFQGIKYQKDKAQLNKGYFKDISKLKLKKVALKYRYQLFGNAPAALVTTINQSSILLLTGVLFGAETLGLYAISIKMLSIPNLVISNSIHKIFFKETQKSIDSNILVRKEVNKIVFLIVILLIPLFSIIIYLSRYVPSFLGEEWQGAASVMMIMVPWFYFKTIADSFSSIYVLFNKQYYELRLQLFFLVGFMGIYIISFVSKISSEQFLRIFVMYSCVYLSSYVITALKIVNKK